MKYIFLLLISIIGFLPACEGDCVLCHPKLIKEDGKLDKEHAILTTCKSCHTQEEMQKIDMGGGCGQDCWECHDIKKVTRSRVMQHQGLQKCIDCHLTLDKNLFGGGSVEPFSATPTLNDLLSSKEEPEGGVAEKITKAVKELNQTKASSTLEVPSREKALSFWEKVVDFFQKLWQKLLTVFN